MNPEVIVSDTGFRENKGDLRDRLSLAWQAHDFFGARRTFPLRSIYAGSLLFTSLNSYVHFASIEQELDFPI